MSKISDMWDSVRPFVFEDVQADVARVGDLWRVRRGVEVPASGNTDVHMIYSAEERISKGK